MVTELWVVGGYRERQRQGQGQGGSESDGMVDA